jgi:hypothetical protein
VSPIVALLQHFQHQLDHRAVQQFLLRLFLEDFRRRLLRIAQDLLLLLCQRQVVQVADLHRRQAADVLLLEMEDLDLLHAADFHAVVAHRRVGAQRGHRGEDDGDLLPALPHARDLSIDEKHRHEESQAHRQEDARLDFRV